MKKNTYLVLSLTLGLLSCGALFGCGNSEIQTIQRPVAPNNDAPKGSSLEAIKNNPNIPESAKRAMLGHGGPPGAPPK